MIDRREPWLASESEILLQLFREHMALEEFCFTGSTDGNPLREAGYLVLIIGPGDLVDAHHVDEFVDVAELHRAEKLYGDILAYKKASEAKAD